MQDNIFAGNSGHEPNFSSADFEGEYDLFNDYLNHNQFADNDPLMGVDD